MGAVRAARGLGQSGNPATEVFEQSWSVYRKVVEHNYLFHREAYGRLREIIDADFRRPFKMLDVACGDASSTAGAVAGTAVAHYAGIDLSEEALRLAASNLAGLGCPVDLYRGDFVSVVPQWTEPVDLIWIGLSLHHLRRPEKLDFLAKVRRILAPHGRLVVYENTSQDGEDREGWLERWDRQRAAWTAFASAEWETLSAHVHGHDYPEPVGQWHRLGMAAGFAEVHEVMVGRTNLFSMFEFLT